MEIQQTALQTSPEALHVNKWCGKFHLQRVSAVNSAFLGKTP